MGKWLSDACWNVYFRYSLTTDILLSSSAHSSPLAIVSGLEESLFWQKPPGAYMCSNTFSFSLTCLFFFLFMKYLFVMGICTFKGIILLIISFMASFEVFVCLFVSLKRNSPPSWCSEFLLPPSASEKTEFARCLGAADSVMIQPCTLCIESAFPSQRTSFDDRSSLTFDWYDAIATCSHCLSTCGFLAEGKTLHWESTSIRSISLGWLKDKV